MKLKILSIFCFFLIQINLYAHDKFTDFYKDDECDSELFFENFLKEIKDDQFDIDKTVDDKKIIVEQKSEKTKKDLEKYLSLYFPKVFLIREKFLESMTPEDIAKSLQILINILTYKPWIYLEQLFKQIYKQLEKEEKKEWKDFEFNLSFFEKFNDKNLKKSLKNSGGFWEFIADQLCFYSEFIRFAKIKLDDHSVFIENRNRWTSSFFDKKDDNKVEPLGKYWERNGITVEHDFYALCFDYFGKLFLEGILNQDLKQASRYHSDLKVIMNRLCGTKYEFERKENIKIYEELLDILKQKIEVLKKDQYGKPENRTDKYRKEMSEFYNTDSY